MSAGTLLVLEPESSGFDVVSAALSLGLRVHVCTTRPPDALPAALREAGVTVTRVDADPASFVKAAVSAAEEHDVVGVAPGFDYAVQPAAAAASVLGLPGLAPAAADVLGDKYRMEQALARAGVPVAQGVPFTLDDVSTALLRSLAARVGFPAVLKPVDGSGSLRVRRVDDLAELRRALAEDTAVGPVEDLGRLVGERMLLEPYLDGPEFSVEGCVTDGGPRVVAVTGKQLGPEPCFVETGHVVEADLEPHDRAALEAVALDAVSALGLTAGAFHLEARLTGSGPVVIEVGARLGGDRIHRLVAQVYGFSLPEAMVRSLTGRPVPERGPARGVAGVRFFSVPRPARLTDPAALRERLSGIPGCTEAAVTCPAGTVLRPATDFRQRFGHAVLSAPDRAALDAAFAAVDRAVAHATLEPLPCVY
ncbi:ATP-grasp domain-containing protein [Streptomyces sp. NPDC052012]|uniref:ATP-grasp domain-containing protein n=1 Tax=Streptomyces sp. NPDC052012 TaxID=3155051 RepID=UPI003450A006